MHGESYSPILTARRASLKLKGKVYRTCVQNVLVYGSETCGVKLNDRKANVDCGTVEPAWH